MDPEEERPLGGGQDVETGPLTIAPIIAGGARRALSEYWMWMEIATNPTADSLFEIDGELRTALETDAGRQILAAFMRSAVKVERAGALELVREVADQTSWSPSDVEFLLEITEDLAGTVSTVESGLIQVSTSPSSS